MADLPSYMIDVPMESFINHIPVPKHLPYEEHEIGDFLEFCRDPQRPFFPKFVCALYYVMAVKRENYVPGVNRLFSSTREAVRAINAKENHICTRPHESDAIAFIKNRMLVGCVSNMTQVFHAEHVFHHNIAVKPCREYMQQCMFDFYFIDHMIAVEHENCCCRSGYCATLIYDQPSTFSPIIVKSMDLVTY